MRSYRTIIAVIVFAVVVCATAVWMSTPGEAIGKFVVAPGTPTAQIIEDLHGRGIVRSRLIFRLVLRVSGFQSKLQPGTFDLSGAASYAEIIRRLASGGLSAEEFELKIIEGWDLRDIKKALEDAGYARAGELYLWTGEPAVDNTGRADGPPDLSPEFTFLADKPPAVGLEGYLFPDTYRIFRDATTEDVIRKLLGNFDRRLTPEMRQRVAASGHSLFEVVTVASVVEREARRPEDRRKVADIFWRRLAAGIPLQSCATVNYVTGADRPAATAEDMAIDSPFNTYKYRGLPLGPIGNPGLDSIVAALDPEPNEYWYFLNDADGNIHFSRTLDEHNANKAKYLK